MNRLSSVSKKSGALHTTKQDDRPLTVFPKIHPVAGAEIDPALVNASSNAFGVGEVPQSYAV